MSPAICFGVRLLVCYWWERCHAVDGKICALPRDGGFAGLFPALGVVAVSRAARRKP